ncbi:hypothetical protein DFH07DRAFT_776743 [Mycena maculata]|uniref:Uncharacterized protein n=1 Tax=Mycena maculata TaxID=230809 RepID=A0AAD7IL99_9AGAR|nr:hypothetical protein DFH07DRAFT_776743 [Mycena maculata]
MAIYEWCWTTEIDPLDLNHRRLVDLLEDQTQIGHRSIPERTSDEAGKAIQETGILCLVHVEDLAHRRSTLDWYLPLDLALAKSSTRWASDTDSEGSFGDLTRNGAVLISQAGRLKILLAPHA